jgi:hypothetical protein
MVTACDDTNVPIADASVAADAPGAESDGMNTPRDGASGTIDMAGTNPDAPAAVTGEDAGPSLAEAGSDATASLALRCTSTGGVVRNTACCETVTDFPNLCAPGACSCAPQSSRMVLTCVCPAPACFVQSLGCVRPSECTPGQDQSCNENLSTSALRGKCNADRTCTCNPGSTLNPATGKCP